MKIGTRFTADYDIGIFKPALKGYRRETVHATLVAVTEKAAKVEKAYIPPARSKAQYFFSKYYEEKEIGKKKNISRLSNVVIVEEPV